MFDIAELREVTAYDELELDTLGDRKTALFLIMSDTDDSFNFLISMCYTQLFNLCLLYTSAYLRTGNFPRAPIWRLCRNKGLHPLRRLRGYPCTPTKTAHPPLASVPFLRVLLSYPGGDTHSHLPL